MAKCASAFPPYVCFFASLLHLNEGFDAPVLINIIYYAVIRLLQYSHYKARIAGDIGREDRGEPTFDAS